MSGDGTDSMQWCLDRLMVGDPTAREEMLCNSQERLNKLADRMLRSFPEVRLWEDTDDVLQLLMIRIDHLLGNVQVATVDAYFRLARANLRQILLSLTRHYKRLLEPGTTQTRRAAQPASSKSAPMQLEPPADLADDPVILAEWSEFHELVDRMPKSMCEVFELLYYQEMRHKDAARLLDLSLATLDRRWHAGWNWIEERQGIPTF